MKLAVDIFEALPDEVQEKVRDHLKAFGECLIVFENEKYHVGGGAAVKAKYAPDHKVIGYVSAYDIYTPEERICNYIKTFHDYPPQYTGERDYEMLKQMRQMKKDGHETPVKLINNTAMVPVPGKFCVRCGSPVWISELEDYSYQCFKCDEDLFGFETEDRLITEET